MPGIEFTKQTERGLELFCDCGAITVLAGGDLGGVFDATAETISVPATGGEVAVTCPGCGTAHWLTFGQRKDAP